MNSPFDKLRINDFHVSVLLKETIEGLRVGEGKRYIDATLGGGGHAEKILELGGIVLGIDVDQEAIEHVQDRIKNYEPRIKEKLTLARGNFRNIDKIAHSQGFDKVSGIMFDLGVSSHQLGAGGRGFSFQKEGPLDMRMDSELGVRAMDLIKILTKGELYEIFTKFGEENRAWAISERIVSARKMKPIETTKDLVDVIGGKRFGAIHAATKVFQALRIAVNDELGSLEEVLPKAIRLLEKNGRLAIISFHSLEDRIVKRSFLNFENMKLGKIITEKPIVPSQEEIEKNRRSRSAKLRIFEKLVN